jgi:hypothetical protein
MIDMTLLVYPPVGKTPERRAVRYGFKSNSVSGKVGKIFAAGLCIKVEIRYLFRVWRLSVVKVTETYVDPPSPFKCAVYDMLYPHAD